MRKQYHLRPSPIGLLAWDVDRLIDLAAHFPRVEVPLGAIRELDELFWFSGDNCGSASDKERPRVGRPD